MARSLPDFVLALRTFARCEVDFIVVGGVCAALHGAAMTTFDLDIVHSRSPENIKRLLTALQEMNAIYRAQAGRVIRPKVSDLVSSGHHLFDTSAGDLDVLGVIGKDRDYEQLLPHTSELEIDPGVRVRVLNLDVLIQTKEEAGREKDKLALPMLRRTLEEKQRRKE